MTREELKEFALKNKDNFSMQLKRHHYDVFELINNQYDFKNFGEKLFVYINGESSIGKCKICDKKTKCVASDVNTASCKRKSDARTIEISLLPFVLIGC